jgi:hypothetical protein
LQECPDQEIPGNQGGWNREGSLQQLRGEGFSGALKKVEKEQKSLQIVK